MVSITRMRAPVQPSARSGGLVRRVPMRACPLLDFRPMSTVISENPGGPRLGRPVYSPFERPGQKRRASGWARRWNCESNEKRRPGPACAVLTFRPRAFPGSSLVAGPPARGGHHLIRRRGPSSPHGLFRRGIRLVSGPPVLGAWSGAVDYLGRLPCSTDGPARIAAGVGPPEDRGLRPSPRGPWPPPRGHQLRSVAHLCP